MGGKEATVLGCQEGEANGALSVCQHGRLATETDERQAVFLQAKTQTGARCSCTAASHSGRLYLIRLLTYIIIRPRKGA